MNPNRIFRQTAVVLSLIAMAMILIAPSTTQSAPEAPAQPPVIIDVEISLYKNVAPGSRGPYNEIIRRFADAVFEASEGENKIGKVTIYQNGQCANKADIVWVNSCHPSGAVSGRAVTGRNINFCDIFPGSMDFISDTYGDQGGGYTLGHEWGHYYYSMLDEYAASYTTPCYFPHSTDNPVPNAVMNHQWNAVNGPKKWLNFSIAKNYDMGGGATRNTAQWRVYGADCWTTLARPVASDPTPCDPLLAGRIYHPELAAVKPAGTNDARIDLVAGHTARSALDIVWGSCSIAYQIVIDRSGSMNDPATKMANAKTAAKMLVDLAPAGYSTIGVISYSDTVLVEQPLIAVTTANKATIKAKIDAITPGGWTAIGDAAKKAHDDLVAAPGLGSYNKTVYLLSDGNSNRGINPVSVIPSYQASNIPMYTFAYGLDADTTLMQKLATDTGGKYYYSPTTLTDITNAFQDANLQSSPAVGISKGTVETANILSPQAVNDIGASFLVDSTLGHFDVVVVYTGALGDMTFEVKHSIDYYLGGNLVCSDDEPSVVKERLCYYGHDINPKEDFGLWNLIYYKAGEGEIMFDYHITGLPDPDQPDPEKRFTYTASVTASPLNSKSLNSMPQDLIKLPQPVKLEAVLSKEIPIKGASAEASVNYEDGPPQFVDLLDNGLPPDTLKDDGIYTGVFVPEQVGAYNVSVQFSVGMGAAMTKAGYQPSHTKDGKPPPPDPNEKPITEPFDRNASIQVTVLDYDKIFLPIIENE